MLNITKVNNSLRVEGIDNNLYPSDGLNEYPLNSLIVVVDDSDIVTFRSAATNDVLFSGVIENITINGETVTKDNIIAKFDAVSNVEAGGGGITDEEREELKNLRADVENALGDISALEIDKQDKLKSGENIKTVNGESLLGEGNINVGGDEHFYSLEYIDENDVKPGFVYAEKQRLYGTATWSQFPYSSAARTWDTIVPTIDPQYANLVIIEWFDNKDPLLSISEDGKSVICNFKGHEFNVAGLAYKWPFYVNGELIKEANSQFPMETLVLKAGDVVNGGYFYYSGVTAVKSNTNTPWPKYIHDSNEPTNPFWLVDANGKIAQFITPDDINGRFDNIYRDLDKFAKIPRIEFFPSNSTVIDLNSYDKGSIIQVDCGLNDESWWEAHDLFYGDLNNITFRGSNDYYINRPALFNISIRINENLISGYNDYEFKDNGAYINVAGHGFFILLARYNREPETARMYIIPQEVFFGENGGGSGSGEGGSSLTHFYEVDVLDLTRTDYTPGIVYAKSYKNYINTFNYPQLFTVRQGRIPEFFVYDINDINDNINNIQQELQRMRPTPEFNMESDKAMDLNITEWSSLNDDWEYHLYDTLLSIGSSANSMIDINSSFKASIWTNPFINKVSFDIPIDNNLSSLLYSLKRKNNTYYIAQIGTEKEFFYAALLHIEQDYSVPSNNKYQLLILRPKTESGAKLPAGNYLAKFEQNGGQIDFTQRGFDGLSEETKSILFKTINGQSLFGMGDIQIQGGGSGNVPTVQTNQTGNENNYIYSIAGNNDGKQVLSKIEVRQEENSLNLDYYVWGFKSMWNTIGLPTATASRTGVMSKDDKKKLDSLSNEWTGTQSEYEALGTYDNNTTYYIVEE